MKLIALLIFIPIMSIADIVELCEYKGVVQSEPRYVAEEVVFTYHVKNTATPKFENEYGAKFNEVCSDTVGKVISIEMSAETWKLLPGLGKGDSYNLVAWYRNGGSPFMFSAKKDD